MLFTKKNSLKFTCGYHILINLIVNYKVPEICHQSETLWCIELVLEFTNSLKS